MLELDEQTIMLHYKLTPTELVTNDNTIPPRKAVKIEPGLTMIRSFIQI